MDTGRGGGGGYEPDPAPEKGNPMKKISPVWLVLGVIAIVVVGFVMAYISANNTGNRYEQNIKASFTQSENVLGQYAPKLREALHVTNLQKDAVRDIITGANTSRYGADGSKAATQFIAEQNPNLDQSSYQRVLNLIEAGRNDFQNAQERTIDQNRAYQTALGNMPGSFFLHLAGYPTPAYTAARYDQIVMSGHAAEAFDTRRDDGVNLNGI
jgi:lysophospholipase L1-like esterase